MACIAWMPCSSSSLRHDLLRAARFGAKPVGLVAAERTDLFRIGLCSGTNLLSHARAQRPSSSGNGRVDSGSAQKAMTDGATL